MHARLAQGSCELWLISISSSNRLILRHQPAAQTFPGQQRSQTLFPAINSALNPGCLKGDPLSTDMEKGEKDGPVDIGDMARLPRYKP